MNAETKTPETQKSIPALPVVLEELVRQYSAPRLDLRALGELKEWMDAVDIFRKYTENEMRTNGSAVFEEVRAEYPDIAEKSKLNVVFWRIASTYKRLYRYKIDHKTARSLCFSSTYTKKFSKAGWVKYPGLLKNP